MKKLGSNFLTSMEVSDRLHITDSTIRAQIGKGKLLGEKRGGIWIFTIDEVQRYERENQPRRKGGRPKSKPAPEDQGGNSGA